MIEKPLDTSKMVEEKKKKLAQPYCGVKTNCVDAVASILIAGGLTELNDYKSWGVPYPSKYISAFELNFTLKEHYIHTAHRSLNQFG